MTRRFEGKGRELRGVGNRSMRSQRSEFEIWGNEDGIYHVFEDCITVVRHNKHSEA